MDRDTRMKISDYERAVNAITEVFLNKEYGCDGEPPVEIDDNHVYWAGDDVGGTLCYGDFGFYSFGDILTDVREDAPAGELERYLVYCRRCRAVGLKDRLNYHSWLHGAPRHSEDTLSRLERLRSDFEKALNDAPETLEE